MYVSAYYHIPKRAMPHMGISRYIRLAPVSIKMIQGRRLVFYYEEECIGEIVRKICADWAIDLASVRLPLKELPQRSAALAIASNASALSLPPATESNKEKGRAHLNGMVHGEDRQEYADNLSVWLSKLDLVREAFELSDEAVQLGAWMDFGISKFNYMRENWKFPMLEYKRKTDGLLHYGSPMRVQSERLPLNASFLSGAPRTWQTVIAEFHQQLEQAQLENYPHDEETLLGRVVHSRPELFECMGNPYSGTFGKLRYLLERASGRGMT